MVWDQESNPGFRQKTSDICFVLEITEFTDLQDGFEMFLREMKVMMDAGVTFKRSATPSQMKVASCDLFESIEDVKQAMVAHDFRLMGKV